MSQLCPVCVSHRTSPGGLCSHSPALPWSPKSCHQGPLVSPGKDYGTICHPPAAEHPTRLFVNSDSSLGIVIPAPGVPFLHQECHFCPRSVIPAPGVSSLHQECHFCTFWPPGVTRGWPCPAPVPIPWDSDTEQAKALPFPCHSGIPRLSQRAAGTPESSEQEHGKALSSRAHSERQLRLQSGRNLFDQGPPEPELCSPKDH